LGAAAILFPAMAAWTLKDPAQAETTITEA
jgi:hypothetical protein